MTGNFFNPDCQSTCREAKFGLCDEKNTLPAFLDILNPDSWIATVGNEGRIEVTFTAIDNCISIRTSSGAMEKRCDCILSYPQNIVFVELKEAGTGGWIPGGVQQLRSTIQAFSGQNDLLTFSKRRAFLANRKFPRFQHSLKKEMEQFRHETGVRLIIENRIIV